MTTHLEALMFKDRIPGASTTYIPLERSVFLLQEFILHCSKPLVGKEEFKGSTRSQVLNKVEHMSCSLASQEDDSSSFQGVDFAESL